MRARHSHHEILGVSATADSDDIRAAYRKLLRTCHPDLGGSPALFDLVNEAYTALLEAADAPVVPTGTTGPTATTSERKATAALGARRRTTRARPTTGAPTAVGPAHPPAVDYVARRRSRSPLWRPQPASAYVPEPDPAPVLVSLYL